MDRILAYIKEPMDPVSSESRNALVVLARFPAAGQVKTRLGAVIGSRAAALLYRGFLEDVRERFDGDRRWTLWWAFEPADSPFATEIARSDRVFPQLDGTLGERMAGAIEAALRRGYGSVVLVGSDIPHLPLERVREAFERLARGSRLVLGPAEDGGYYLLAARSVPPVFTGIEWGGPLVLRATIESARNAGIEPELLAATYDIDGLDDLERLRREIRAGTLSGLEATAAALERIGALGYK